MTKLMTDFDNLPDCVLLRVFKKFHSKVDIWRARRVCRRWYNLLADSELWKICNLSNFKFDSFALVIDVMNYTPFQVLQYLEINNTIILTDVLRVILEIAKNLKGLRLNGCTIRPVDKHLESNEIMLPDSIPFLDVRKSIGNFGFLESLIRNIGHTVKVLGVSNYFGSLQRISNKSFLYYMQNLTILECQDCVWMNDDYLDEIGKYCTQLRSINLCQCLNIQGRSLPRIVRQCKNLNTLILRRTSIRDDVIFQIDDWSKTNIKELDISHCYYIDDDAINKLIIELAPQLEYLCCAITDEIVFKMVDVKLKLKTFELRRRHPINVENIIELLSNCKSLENLDISLTPVDNEAFESILPHLTNLRWLSFAGHEVLKTNECLRLISNYCWDIETIGINYYQAIEDTTLQKAIMQLILSSPNLKYICIEGVHMRNIVNRLEQLILIDKRFKTNQVKFINTNDLHLPSPKLCVNSYASKLNQENKLDLWR